MPELRTPPLSAADISSRPQPTLRAEGIVLRPWRPEDAAMLARAYSDPAIQRWHGRTMDEREALEWMRTRHERWGVGEGGDWAVLVDEQPVGRVSLHKIVFRDACAEIGYWVLPEARGRGVAPRALRTLAAWLFAELGFHRLELEHSSANPASCRVAEKAGFLAEGTRRRALMHEDGWHDMHVHARLGEDRPPAG